MLLFARPPVGASLATVALAGTRRCTLEYGGYDVRHGGGEVSCEARGKRQPPIAFDGLVPLSILLLWLLTESLPLAPTLDWQKIKDALKPLLEFNFSLPGA